MTHPASTHPTTPEARRSGVTFEAWLATAPDSRITEWVGGEVIEMSPVSVQHDDIAQWLITMLRLFLRVKPLGSLRAAPFALRLQQSDRGREPDLMFVSNERAPQVHDSYAEGPVDAVWEIVSPESVARDRGEKFVEYEQEGIREYWLIDPTREQLELFRLGEDDHYHAILPQGGKIESTVLPGFYLRPEWLWAMPKPDEFNVLREWGLLD